MGTLTLQSIPQQLPDVIRLRLDFLKGFDRRLSEINRDTRGNYFFRFFRLLCEAGIAVCTAEAQRARRKSPKNSKSNKSPVNSVLLSLRIVAACANFLTHLS